MLEEIIIAGFGGQGILTMGMITAQAAMLEGKNVSWVPSYGPEMRGGTANCTVMISDDRIGSVVSDFPTVVVVMNKPSKAKFEPVLRKGGLLVLNRSMVDDPVERDDVEVIELKANELAEEMGNLRVAGVIAVGAMAARKGLVSLDSLKEGIKLTLAGKQKLWDVNFKALEKGFELGSK